MQLFHRQNIDLFAWIVFLLRLKRCVIFKYLFIESQDGGEINYIV